MSTRKLILAILLLAGCGIDHPAGTKAFDTIRLSFYYPDTWIASEDDGSSVLISNQPLTSDVALLGKGMSSGQAAIYVIWYEHEDWLTGISAAETRTRLLSAYQGDGARWGYMVDTTKAYDETLDGKTVSIAPMSREYQPGADDSTKIRNEGLLIVSDFGNGSAARITCLADEGEFAQFEAACKQVAESMQHR